MLALNKLTVYSNARPGITHSVTDNVIAADTTKYRNPLDKVLPEHEKPQSIVMTAGELVDREEVSEKQLEEKSSDSTERTRLLRPKWEPHNISRNTGSSVPPPFAQPRRNSEVIETLTFGAKKFTPLVIGRESQKSFTFRGTEADVKFDKIVTSPGVSDYISNSSAPGLLPAVEPALDTGRHSRSVRHTRMSSPKSGPPLVTLVPEPTTFGGAFCCGKDAKMVPVTRLTSPSMPANENQQARLSRKKRNTASANLALQQQQQQQNYHHNPHRIDVPEVTSDLTSSTSHATSSSENNASSVVLLPVIPPILGKKSSKPKDCLSSPPLARLRDNKSPCIHVNRPSYSPSQVIQNSARSVACYFSTSSSSPSLDENNKRTVSRTQRTGRTNSPSLSTLSAASRTAHQKLKSSTSKNTFRRAKSTAAAALPGAANSPTMLRKTYQGGGKRSLSPTKSPEEVRKIPASSSLNLAAYSARGRDPVHGVAVPLGTRILRRRVYRDSPTLSTQSKDDVDDTGCE